MLLKLIHDFVARAVRVINYFVTRAHGREGFLRSTEIFFYGERDGVKNNGITPRMHPVSYRGLEVLFFCLMKN